MNGHCPKCGSRLYPEDKRYIDEYGYCSACVTWGPKCIKCNHPLVYKRKDSLCDKCREEVQKNG